MSELTGELMSESATDGVTLDDSLMSMAQSFDGVDIEMPDPKSEPEADEDEPSFEFEGDEAEGTAEFLVDGIETAVQLFVDDEYELEYLRKQAAIGAYAKFLRKRQGKVPPWLAKYKEEIICVGITLLIFYGIFRHVGTKSKAAKAAKEINTETTDKKAKETDGGDKSE